MKSKIFARTFFVTNTGQNYLLQSHEFGARDFRIETLKLKIEIVMFRRFSTREFGPESESDFFRCADCG
jgi:hypothetical protein